MLLDLPVNNTSIATGFSANSAAFITCMMYVRRQPLLLYVL